MSLHDDLMPEAFQDVLTSRTPRQASKTEQLPTVDTQFLRATPPASLACQTSHALRAVQRAPFPHHQTASAMKERNTSLRPPLVIKGTRKKGYPLSRDHHKTHRMVLSLLATLVLLVITAGTLFMASPLGHEASWNNNPLQEQGGNSLIQNQNSNLAHLAPQATATAVAHQKTDGYDPSAKGTVTVAKSPSTSSGSNSNHHPWSQCG